MKNTEIRSTTTHIQRSYSQIEKDYSAWRKVLLSNDDITSWISLAENLGVPVDKVHRSFNRHPKSKKQLQALLDTRKRSFKASPDTEVSKESESTEVTNTSDVCTLENEADYEFKHVTICDMSSLMHGFQSCITEPIVIPNVVMKNLERVSTYRYELDNAKKAIRALSYIGVMCNWATVVPDAYSPMDMIVSDPDANIHNKIVCALACRYAKDGYYVTVKTRSSYLFNLIKRQGIDNLLPVFIKEDPALV